MKFKQSILSISLVIAGCLMLSSCNVIRALDNKMVEPAKLAEKTPSQKLLESLPASKDPVALSVYEFQDYTGANKPNDNLAEFSRAVTQGGAPILYKALQDAGKGKWFTIIERAGLKNLLQERQLIRATREQYTMPDGSSLPDVAPMLYAGVLLEGGIVAYESNVLTGGAGAGYLGLSANSQYRRDVVTIYLRAVSVQNGEVLLNINTSKTIYSTMVTANVFRYVALNELLEAETGFSVNEPPQLAVRQAIEYGVYAMVMEGIEKELWSFAEPEKAKPFLRDYLKKRDGEKPTEQHINRLLKINPSLPNTASNRPAESSSPSYTAPVQPAASAIYTPPASVTPNAESVAMPTQGTTASNQGNYYDVVCNAKGCFPAAQQQ